MSERFYPKVDLRQIEDERQDAIFYKNPYMYDFSELAALGLIVKNLGTEDPLNLVESLKEMMQVQKDRERDKPKEPQQA